MYSFICQECDNSFEFKQANHGCPDCGHHLFVVAYNLGIPRSEYPLRDPYRRKRNPGEEEGPKLTMPGNEGLGPTGEPYAGGGSTVRSKDDPRAKGDTSMYADEYANEVKKDIDDMEEPVFPIESDTPREGPHITDGANDGRFFDPNDPLGASDALKKRQPKGPHNMPHQQGTRFDRLTDSLYDYLRNKRSRR